MQRTAKVYEEGRFLKVIDMAGNDISNQVERNVRRAAIQNNVDLVFDGTQWQLSSFAPAFKPTIVEEELDTDPHSLDKVFIHESPKFKPDELIMSDLKWKYLVRSAVASRNILMTGRAGSGKTMAAKFLVSALKHPEFYFNLGATQDPRATLIGNTHFSKDTGTYFSESLFVKAIQTENAVILLDELSRAHPEAWNILMTVLDYNQRYLRLDEKDGAPTIKVAPGVCFIATANIGNEYTATRVIDRALLDRFIIIEMDDLNKDQEYALLKMTYPKVDDYDLKAVAEITSWSREEVVSEKGKLTSCLSTRLALEIASLIYDGFTMQETAEVAIYPFFSADGGVDSERTYVKQFVQKFKNPKYAEPDNLFNTNEIKS